MNLSTKPLFIASHNVNGFCRHLEYTKLHALCRVWESHGFDVVCLQETHLTNSMFTTATFHLNNASEIFGGAGWTPFWAPAASSQSCGCAILIRTPLIISGAIEVGEPRHLNSGRLLTLPLKWGGHTFKISSIYAPVDNIADKINFVTSSLSPLHESGGAHIWAGDFNFVHTPPLDCSITSIHATRDRSIARHFTATCPLLLDTFRTKHPTRRGYTRINPNSAARLDRILVTSTILSYITTGDICGGWPSDHRITTCKLSQAIPPRIGPGLLRVRTYFLKHPTLVSAFQNFLDLSLPLAPDTDDAFLVWWPNFKLNISREAARLNKIARITALYSSDQLAATQVSAANI
jgi:exonuclease III